jgi:hypothetical protein
LEIAVRQFVPAHGKKGPTIWLTGVSHIGETNYFQGLQKHLNAQSLVLFEGVGEHPPKAEELAAAKADNEKRSSLQSTMAAALGLEFQLDGIDYDNPKFRNSDLTIAEIRKLMMENQKPQGQGEVQGGGAVQSFDSLMQLMEGGTWFNTLLQFALKLLGSDPKLQVLSKLALVEALGQMQGDPSQLGGLPPDLKQLLDVLIKERNQKVINDLKAELKKKTRAESIALFYGTGHMPDMERRLREQLHYQPAGQIWFAAVTADVRRAGVTPSERQFIHTLIRNEMEQFKTLKR